MTREGGSGLKISLAAWSLHRAFFARELDQLGMLQTCAELGIGGFELVNTFFPSPQYAYLRHMKKRADELGVELLLIMCDLEGDLAHVEREKRVQAARNHRKWIDIAGVLGCHGIRVNARGDDTDPAAMRERAAEGLALLLDYAAGTGVDVVIENHGGLSSDAAWLVSLIELVGSPHLGTLPDFGNFPPEIDRPLRRRREAHASREGRQRQVLRLRAGRQRDDDRLSAHDRHRQAPRLPGLHRHRVRGRPA